MLCKSEAPAGPPREGEGSGSGGSRGPHSNCHLAVAPDSHTQLPCWGGGPGTTEGAAREAPRPAHAALQPRPCTLCTPPREPGMLSQGMQPPTGLQRPHQAPPRFCLAPWKERPGADQPWGSRGTGRPTESLPGDAPGGAVTARCRSEGPLLGLRLRPRHDNSSLSCVQREQHSRIHRSTAATPRSVGVGC